MRKVTIALFLFTIPAIWAQKYPKRPAVVAADGSVHQAVSLHIRSLKGRAHSLRPEQALVPAPGVAQCWVDPSGVLSGLFVNTSTIPTGSTITGTMTLLDDNSAIDFTGETLTQALSPGSVVFLPSISSFGDLWLSSGASLDIQVQVQPPRGATTTVDCEVLVGEGFVNSDLTANEPLINAVTQSVATNNDLILNLNGYFTGDTAQVVLTDLYSVYLVPASAVSLVSGSQINVDLSQVPGMDLSYSDTFYLTVSQDGFSDTVVYRYLPGPAGFNPAPQ